MQKKLYTIDLSLDEIQKRLWDGEKIYNDNDGCYIKMYNNALALYEENTLVAFNPTIYTKNNQYFLVEEEEPNADESCIGKLCKFYGEDEIIYDVGILKAIKNNQFQPRIGTRWYDNCKILSKEEALTYVKE